MSSNINQSVIIPASCNRLRLDKAMATLFSDFSRSQLQLWIKNGDVTLDGEIQTNTRQTVYMDQEIILCATLTPKADWKAQDIELTIIYEDEDILIINKPVGLVVHPGAGNPDNTLLNALLHHCQSLEYVPRAGIIHRLDKNTSGLLIIAKNLEAHNDLTKQLAAREISREYQAIVQGTIISGSTVDAPIARHAQQRTKMTVREDGKEAMTHYRVKSRYRAHTHITLKLETGRTHQIRVHMQHIHFPIVGDPLYGTRRIPGNMSEALALTLKHMKRQALHAFAVTFIHPTTKETVSFECPLPADMQDLLKALEQDEQWAAT